MVDTARPTQRASLRRDAILEAIAFAAERLLRTADWRDAIQDVLAHLGEAADVSRAYVVTNDTDPAGEITAMWIAEWTSGDTRRVSDDPAFRTAPWREGFGRWAESLGRDTAIFGNVEDFPEGERAILAGQGVLSLASFPLSIDGAWWGAVGFDDCVRLRDWSGPEAEVLRTAATLIGAAIERQRQEMRMREAEHRYRTVVEEIPAVSYSDEAVTVDGKVTARLTYVSPQVTGLLGIEPSRLIEEPTLWFDLIHPDDFARMEAIGAFDVADLEPFDQEYRMRHADGRWIWVRDTSGAVFRDDGSLAYFQGFMTDITERKEAEERRIDAETRYRNVVESIPAIAYVEIASDDPNGPTAHMSFVGPQIEALTGIAADRFVTDQGLWFSLMHPDDLATLRSSGTMNAAHTAAWEAEYRFRNAAGGWSWVQDTSVGVFAEDGTLSHFQGFAVDITARKDAEIRLQQAQERLRVLVEQMPAIVYTRSVDEGSVRVARTDYVSPASEAILGYLPEMWTADPDFMAKVLHPGDAARVAAIVERTNATGEPMSIDYRMIAADGKTVWIHDEAVLIRAEDGSPSHWQGVMLDVTERAEAAEQIQVAEERFRTIVEQTPAITYQEIPWASPDDAHSVISYVSPQAERLLGYPAERWAEPGFWHQVIHPDDLPAVLEASAATSGEGTPYRQDYRMVAADGTILWFHDESELIHDPDGDPLVWQGVLVDITERKTAEERLRHAQERLQALIEHIPAVVYLEAPDAAPERFYISPQVEAIFGHTAQEWTWTPDFWVDHLHPDDRGAALEADRASDVDLQRYSLEYRFRRADGTYIWVHDEAAFIESDGGGFWQGFLYDVTDRKEAEGLLLAAERVYRATVEHLPAVVYREPPTRDQLSNMYISPQVVDLIGYTADEWRAEVPGFWADHIHPDDRDRVSRLNDEANTSGTPFAADYRMRRKDGTYVWVHDEASLVDDGEGTGWWQGFILDITRRMEAEQRIRAGEATFRAIVEQSPAVIYTQEFDPNDPSVSKTTYISPRQTEVFGYAAEEMIEDPTLWTRTIHPEDRERVLSADVASNQRAEDSFSLEYRMIAQDGRVVWVQDQANLVHIEDQAPFWQGFLLDITERKEAEAQLERALEVEREATRSLRALDEMKNTFLQAVSHDLRTPLAAILGLAITLERGDVHLEEADAKDLAHRIAGNARRLDRLVTNLLDLDRLARGIVTPNLHRIDVGALVRRVLAESELIPDARLRLTIDPVEAAVDGAKVERIVENLLANTARHTPEDTTVWVTVRAQEAGVLILVEDDGPGIPEAVRESLFEPFRQGPDAPQHSPGVGVGLTLVRRFAEIHGGRAWIEERNGGGASFRVLLPGAPVAEISPAGG